MEKVGVILRDCRKEMGLTISEVAEKIQIDQGLLSRIERGVRAATRQQLNLLINFFKLEEKSIVPIWLSGKVLYELREEPYALEALRVAEQEVKYGLDQRLKHEHSGVINYLIEKVDSLKVKWDSKGKLNQTQLQKMQEHFNIKYTYESNKIEGNTLTLQETYLVISEGVTIGGKSIKEHLEAINHQEAIDYLSEITKGKEPFTERVLNEIHYLILKGIDKSNAGKYRNVPVMISGSVHVPPQPYLIRKQMEEIFDFYRFQNGKMHPVVLAAEMHERIVTVHPFIDGNGRTSRLVMNLVLLMNGYTTVILKGDITSRQLYYNSLENSRIARDNMAFHKLILEASIKSLEEHLALT